MPPQGNILHSAAEKLLQVLFERFQQPKTRCGTLPEFIQEQWCGQQRAIELAFQCREEKEGGKEEENCMVIRKPSLVHLGLQKAPPPPDPLLLLLFPLLQD